jgi:hypothetical protein
MPPLTWRRGRQDDPAVDGAGPALEVRVCGSAMATSRCSAASTSPSAIASWWLVIAERDFLFFGSVRTLQVKHCDGG